MTSLSRALPVALACALGSGMAWAVGSLSITTQEPRAFGYQVGDVLERHVVIEVPAGLQLDDTSLPRSGQGGKAIELRALDRQDTTHDGAQRIALTLHYQVFVSPPEVRTFEIAPMSLHFVGTPRVQDLRVDAWPVTVAPLVPVQASPRNGLGEMRPDAPPPLIDTTPEHRRLLACGTAAALLLAYLAHVYLAVPLLGRRQRPFETAWRELRALRGAATPWPQALALMHRALNRSAGEVLYEPGLARFIERHTRYAPLHDELQRFYRVSQQAFFDPAGPSDADMAWLLGVCRRCLDAERGAA